MYRIDEDTYIDDSLVTCAEYQLFIDEMRAKNKFYQLDHWNSYRLIGFAHAPILGVRPSDAKAFCRWLSQRENGEWFYRLPTKDEAIHYPILKHNKWLSGFWVLNGIDNHLFYWAGPKPINARGIDFSIFDIDLVNTYTHNINLICNYALDIDNLSSLVSYFEIDFDLIRARGRDLNLARAQEHARRLAIQGRHGRDADSLIILWGNLITLQERIAGRSPAFEGIRLVKTRASH